MTPESPPDVLAILRSAARQPMLPPAEWRGPTLDRRRVQMLLPHRDPFLLIDGVVHVDHTAATIVCVYDLHRSASIFEGHFPGRPIWPGVLQVEAIGQAGLCLMRHSSEASASDPAPGFSFTHILGAEFVRPVTPTDQLEIVARVLADGLFNIVVGQCLQRGVVCSAAAVRGLNKEDRNES